MANAAEISDFVGDECKARFLDKGSDQYICLVDGELCTKHLKVECENFFKYVLPTQLSYKAVMKE
jgi:hypothetical protein